MQTRRAERSRAVIDVASTLALTVVLTSALSTSAAVGPALGLVASAAAIVVPGVAAASVLRRTPVFTTIADRVTLLRICLIGVCSAHVALWLFGAVPAQSWLLFAAATPAVALDAVDGWVARRTQTCTPEGSRLDMEADAALFLILSIPLGAVIGWWVWLIGALRYVFVAGMRLRPQWRGTLEYSDARRVIAAVQGVVLAAFAGPWFPAVVEVPVSAAACALLVVSFGRDVVTLERQSARPLAGGREQFHTGQQQ